VVCNRIMQKRQTGSSSRPFRVLRPRNLIWDISTRKVRESRRTTSRQPTITGPAEQGHPTAQNNLASLYEHGWGVPKNPSEAISWYRAAAEQGDPTACNLATTYLLGRGVRRDDRQAATWFLAAAQQGFAVAQANLAFMYYTGRGIGRDYAEAAKWTMRAAEHGYAFAETDLGYLYEQGKGVPLDYLAAYK